MEILTEFDELQNALSKINMNESIMPFVNGRLVDDESYNKIQKILNCPEMVSCHKYLYNLDLDQLNEDEIDKVDKLYKLGCDRGFIIDDLTKWDDDNDSIDDATAKITDEVKAEKPIAGTLFKAKVPCWTIIYSATSKDGQIKTGEAYSNAISAAAAKADVKSKLSNIGYSNISILAIESCEADVEAASFNDETSTTLAEADDEDNDKDEESKDDTSDKESSDEDKEDDSDDSDDEDSAEEDKDDESSDTESDDAESSDDSNEDDDKSKKTEDDTSDDSENDDSDEDDESKDDKSEDDAEDDSKDDDSDEDDDSDKDEKELFPYSGSSSAGVSDHGRRGQRAGGEGADQEPAYSYCLR